MSRKTLKQDVSRIESPKKDYAFLSAIDILEILKLPEYSMLLVQLYERHKGDFLDIRYSTQVLRDFFSDLVTQPKILIRYLRYSRSWIFGPFFDHFNQLQLIARLPKLTITGRVVGGAVPGADMLPWKFPQIVDTTAPLFEDSNSFSLRLGLFFDTKVPTLLPDESNKEPDLLAAVSLFRTGRDIQYCYESAYIPFEVANRILEVAFRMENQRTKDR